MDLDFSVPGIWNRIHQGIFYHQIENLQRKFHMFQNQSLDYWNHYSLPEKQE